MRTGWINRAPGRELSKLKCKDSNEPSDVLLGSPGRVPFPAGRSYDNESFQAENYSQNNIL